jgi:hypothetical protein
MKFGIFCKSLFKQINSQSKQKLIGFKPGTDWFKPGTYWLKPETYWLNQE